MHPLLLLALLVTPILAQYDYDVDYYRDRNPPSSSKPFFTTTSTTTKTLETKPTKLITIIKHFTTIKPSGQTFFTNFFTSPTKLQTTNGASFWAAALKGQCFVGHSGPSVRPSIHQSVRTYICTSIGPSVCPSVKLSIPLSVLASIIPSVYLSVRTLSLYPNLPLSVSKFPFFGRKLLFSN